MDIRGLSYKNGTIFKCRSLYKNMGKYHNEKIVWAFFLVVNSYDVTHTFHRKQITKQNCAWKYTCIYNDH